MALVLPGWQPALEATAARAWAPGLPQLGGQVPPGWAGPLENSCRCSSSLAGAWFPGLRLASSPARTGGQEGGSAVVLPLGTLGTEDRGLGYSLGSAGVWSPGTQTARLTPCSGREGVETGERKQA